MEIAGKRVFLTLIKEEAKVTPNQDGGSHLVLDGEVTAKFKKPVTAIVAHKGKDVTFYEVGDIVHIGQFYSDEQEIEGVKYVITKEEDILAKL